MNKPLIIITGASSGIGAATAKVFSEAGYPVGLIARQITPMKALNLKNAYYEAVDVTDFEALSASITKLKSHASVACLINNAGFARGGDFCDLPQEADVNMVNVNMLGLINVTKLILPEMRKQQFGTVVNISSVADRKSRPNLATYAATKAAVKSLTESLRVANAKHNIRFCCIAPGIVNTPMLIAGKLNQKDAINVDQLAQMILWVFQQPQNVCVRDLEVAPTSYEL